MPLRIKYALFYDFHTSTIIPDVGRRFDVEAFTDQLVACGVDFLTWHARCNQGNAYYDTAIGKRHPSLDFDLFGQLVASCHRKGIKISAYFNGGLTDQELLEHREWMRIAPDGRTLAAPEHHPTPAVRAVCYNSPFRDHLKAMAREVAVKYAVDGFFFDCMMDSLTCVCPTCVTLMTERGVNFRDPAQLTQFTRASLLQLARELFAEVRAINPEALFFLNGCLVEDMIGYNTQLECECLPTAAALGYDYLPVHAHYLRTVAQGNPVLNMTGRFYEWGDFGGLRKPESLEYDLFYGLAHGMRPELSDHFHPRGDFSQPVFDLIRPLYNDLQQYDEWCDDAVNCTEVAIVFPKPGAPLRFDKPLRAAVRMLSELKVQFDVVTHAAPWDKYQVLIFPDHINFNEETTERVRQCLRRGAAVIATGDSGLNEDGSAFALQEWPVEYMSPSPHNPVYFQPEGELAAGLPELPMSFYADAALVRPAPGADVAMRIVRPYHNREWDGLHANYYTPPDDVTAEPFLAIKGKIAYLAGKIFLGYYRRSPYQLRLLLGNLLRRFLPRPLLQAPTLPSFARAAVQKTPSGSLLVHLLAYAPELRGESVALEDRVTLADTEILLRLDGRRLTRVYLAPERTPLPFTVADDVARVVLPVCNGHAIIVFE